MRIGRQIAEAIRMHLPLDHAAARARAVELLDLVQVPSARNRYDDYPHQFSGGMRQRVTIAMALACRPRLLIADEATTALDVEPLLAVRDLAQEFVVRGRGVKDGVVHAVSGVSLEVRDCETLGIVGESG